MSRVGWATDTRAGRVCLGHIPQGLILHSSSGHMNRHRTRACFHTAARPKTNRTKRYCGPRWTHHDSAQLFLCLLINPSILHLPFPQDRHPLPPGLCTSTPTRKPSIRIPAIPPPFRLPHGIFHPPRR